MDIVMWKSWFNLLNLFINRFGFPNIVYKLNFTMFYENVDGGFDFTKHKWSDVIVT